MTVFQGQGKLAGLGAVHALSSTPEQFGTASLLGAGTFVVANRQTSVVNPAILSGLGALAASLQQINAANASLLGLGALSVIDSGPVQFATPAPFAGSGALVAALNQTSVATALLSGAGSLAVNVPGPVQFISASFSGLGTLVVPANQLAAFNPAPFAGQGSLTADAESFWFATASLIASGALVCGEVQVGALYPAPFAGLGALITDAGIPVPPHFATALLAGIGTLYADSSLILPPGPRPNVGNFLFLSLSTFAVTNPASLPNPAISGALQVRANAPVTLFIPAWLPTWTFVKPDGTRASPNYVYTYATNINGTNYTVYSADAGEFDQPGWWLLDFPDGAQCFFYIWP
jgi:hypothetical protein